MRTYEGRNRLRILLLMFTGLPALSAIFLVLERVTHVEFFLHLAAIPLEILLGAFLVERWMAKKERESKLHQLMHLKSYLFRSEMRNVFIANFKALKRPEISLARIKDAGLDELMAMRAGITGIEYRSIEEMEPVILEYVNARKTFYFFLQWAVDHDFESIFQDMIYILHFIQDVQLFKRNNPDDLFIREAERHPPMMEKVNRILRDGVCKFLDYCIELKVKQPEVLDELLSDYLISSRMKV